MSLAEALALGVSTAGVAVALGTLIKAYAEYRSQGDQRRIELFLAMRQRLKEPKLAEVAEHIDQVALGGPDAGDAAAALAALPLRHKRDYVGLFEEVALFMRGGQIEPDIAHYMFGYYALLCEECEPFWTNINPDSPYWSIFHEFCDEMRLHRDALIARQFTDEGPAYVISPSG
jgi:hypothetical protein